MPLKLLIVEDEVLIAEMMKMYLIERGHQVTDICVSYEEAVAAYQKELPDLALLDIRLYGKKSGIDFARWLSEQPEHTPFVYVSSQYDRRTLDLALETSPYGYLTKPIQHDSLFTTIETAFAIAHREENTGKQINLQDGNQQYMVNERQIVCIQAEHVYARVYLTDGKQLLNRSSLSDILTKLEGDYFLQCHRSYLVNLMHVNAWKDDSLSMNNGILVPVSRGKRGELETKLDSLGFVV
ncbi:MAG: response regulator [Bacteroidota bacterium]